MTPHIEGFYIKKAGVERGHSRHLFDPFFLYPKTRHSERVCFELDCNDSNVVIVVVIVAFVIIVVVTVIVIAIVVVLLFRLR